MPTLNMPSRSALPALALCDACLTPVLPLPMTHRPGVDEILCPVCAARVALEDAAADHLHALIYPTVIAWARHWSAAGLSDEALSGSLALEGYHWHPHGAIERGPVNAHDSAAAVVREALDES